MPRLRRIGLWLGLSRHGLDIQILHGDESVLLGEFCGGLLDPVVPTADDAPLQGVELIQGLLAPLGGELGGLAAFRLVDAVLAGHSALEALQPLQFGLRWLRHVHEGPAGRGHRMHASTVEADHAIACPRQWQGHIDEHDGLIGPVDVDAGVGANLLVDAHVDDDAPVDLLARLDPSRRVHAGDDDHAALAAGLVEDGVACLGGVAPADEAQAAMARLEAGNTAADGLLAFESGGPFGVLEPVGGGQYRRRHGGHPRALEARLLVRERLSHVRAAQRLLDPIDDLAGIVLDRHVMCSSLAALVESGAPSVAQPHHDTLGIPGPTGIAAVVHAKEDARANVLDAVNADLLAHRGPPPFIKALCVPALNPSAEARGMNFFGHASAASPRSR